MNDKNGDNQSWESYYQQLMAQFGGCGCGLCEGKSRVNTVTLGVLSPEDTKTVNMIAATLDMITRDVSGLCGWEAIACLIEDGNDAPTWTTSFVPEEEGEGKSCANKKLATLKGHPYIFSTSEMVNKSMEPDEVSWHGALRIPFIGFRTGEDGKTKFVKGELLIIFSGAKEIIDLAICVKMLKAAIVARSINALTRYIYDTSGCRADQVIDFMFKNEGLKEHTQV